MIRSYTRRRELNLLGFYSRCIARALSSSTEIRAMPRATQNWDHLVTQCKKGQEALGESWRILSCHLYEMFQSEDMQRHVVDA